MNNILGIKPEDKFQSYCLDPKTYQLSLHEYTAKDVDKWNVYTTNDQIRHISTIPEYFDKFNINKPNLGIFLSR